MTERASRPTRNRFDGVLDAEELEEARQSGIPLAYCPVQIGWVPLSALDEDEAARPLSWRIDPERLPKRIVDTPVYLQPERLSLRPWSEDDLPLYRDMLRDPGLWTYMLEPEPRQLDDETLRALIALSAERSHHIVYAVIHKGQPIGQVRLEFGADRASGEVSYWLGAAARGQGLGAKMLSRFLTHLDNRHAGVTRLTARVHPDNAASRRMLLACGFAPCERAALGLHPRGRDDGTWDGFLRQRPPA